MRNAFRSVALLTLLVSPLVAASACGDDEQQKPSPTPSGGGGSGGSTGGSDVGGTGGAPPEGLTIDGLDGPITAAYDENGLLHLTCASDHDCYAGLGYFHAANRFFFMDFVRNLVRGSLASLVKGGDVVLEQDYENRRFFTTPSGDPLETAMYQAASPEVRGYMDAYARGVNAWIEDMRQGENDATLTTEYDFLLIVKENIRDWEPEDSAAVGLYVLNDLSNNSAIELSLAEWTGALDPALGADIFSHVSVFDAFTDPLAPLNLNPPAIGGTTPNLIAPPNLARQAFDRLKKVGSGAHANPHLEIGSNNWAVGPSQTADGNALLANDPHLLLSNPSIWFGVEIDAKSAGDGTFHVAGSTFPGLPSVMVGRNEDIAWGVTTAYWDLADVYVEELTSDGNNVVFNGSNVPIIERDFDFADAATGGTITRTFRYVPHHGPVISEDLANNTAITIRWRGHDAGTDLDAFFGIAQASSVDQARTAVESITSASQNFVVIDRNGNFGWFPYSQVPSRPWASPAQPAHLPLPGDGSFEWGPPVPLAELPQLLNPATGFIATANQDHTGAGADGDPTNDNQPALQAISRAEGTREQRIIDQLEAGAGSHTIATMNDLHGDVFSLYGEAITPEILSVAAGATLSPEAQAVANALSSWQYTCPTGVDGSDPQGAKTTDGTAAESIGCMAFHTTFFELISAALGDEFLAAGIPLDGSRFPMHLVARSFTNPASIATGDLMWDDVSTTMGPAETRDDQIVVALEAAGARLAAEGPADDWRWGRYHTLTLQSIYAAFGIGEYNEGPYAAPGGQYTVNVANISQWLPPSANAPVNHAFSSGPSVRFVVEASANGLSMTYQLPGGNDLHRDSPFYNNLLPKWLEVESIDFPFGPGAVPDPAVALEVTPTP